MKKNKKRKETGNYIFPNILGNFMKNISQRTQYEASMMSMTFILLGLFGMAIYISFTDISWIAKILTLVNALAGFVFLSSMLVTTFQQYRNYLIITEIIQEEE